MQKLYQPTVRNVLVNSPHYGAILAEYNKRFKDSAMTDKRFWEEVIQPLIPTYSLMSWYQFLRRWKDAAGLANVAKQPLLPQADPIEQQKALSEKFLANDEATRRGIGLMLNIGNATLEEIANNPELLAKLPLKERIALLTQAMKAQDSRIHAVGKVKEDNRQQARFDHAFGESAMG